MAKSRTAAASANRRPKTLLSGLLVCGVCGGSVAKRGNNRFGCVSHIMGKGCTNTRTVNRDALEARVIVGLRDSLMAPEVIGEAMRAMVEETNRLNQQRRASRDVDVQQLEKARKGIAGIVAAIEDGGYSRPLMERLKVLEVEVEALEAQIAEAPADVPDVHPNVADLYRRKVERLIEALDRPEDRDRAAQALRAVIDSIVVTPGEKRGEVLVQLMGDFRKVIAWATERQVAEGETDEASCVEALSVPRASRAGMTVF